MGVGDANSRRCGVKVASASEMVSSRTDRPIAFPTDILLHGLRRNGTGRIDNRPHNVCPHADRRYGGRMRDIDRCFAVNTV
jgi:hypothetical protein